MRILVVSQYFWPEAFRVNDVVAELVRRGHEVTVLTGRPNYPGGEVFEDYRRNPAAFSHFEGAEVLRVPLRPRGQGSLRLMLNYLSFVLWGLFWGPWLLRGRGFDAIFMFQTSPITAALPALLLGRLKRAPVLMWVLDLWPDTLAAVGVVKSPRVLGWVGRLVAFIYRRCARVLVQSKAFYSNVERWGGRRHDIRYFPAWAESTFDQELDEAVLAPELEPYTEGFNVMFAGNIGEAQDFPAIVHAADLLRHRNDIRWLVLGDGRAAPWLREEIARRGLADRVILLGRHPLERMPSFFKGAGALLVSLKPEPIFAMTIPGKVQSYLASGIPLVGMLDGEGARVIMEAGAGRVAPAGDAHALAEQVQALAGLPAEERRRMGQAGRAYCRREFDRNQLMSSLERWLAEAGTETRSR
ncbi:MAG: glycosyltransferase family 4 protein [Caldimonas sp.]|uniref:glycosyltransferase family 4 protein n=1 Tax=Caldimonas sp. TaxID=2838790 RepID=UPI00391C6731